MCQAILKRIMFTVVATAAMTSTVYGQPSATTHPKASAPILMNECEGNTCGSWKFLGLQGNGRWPNGDVANLVYNIEGDTIIIRRADLEGPHAGLTSVYKGTRDDDGISGKFISSWPGHWDRKSGNWYAMSGATSPQPPTIIHFCAQHCGSLILDSGPPFDKPHYGSEAAGSIWVVDNFTPESVIIRRTDSRPRPYSAVYTSRISSDGNSISGNGWKMVWGAALNTLPGSDAEREARGPSPGDQLTSVPKVEDITKTIDLFVALKHLYDSFQ
jgi:hypothetical protein